MVQSEQSEIVLTKPHHWIDSDEALVSAMEPLLQAERVAVDTEFVRTKTFYPCPGLIQVADEQQVILVDPLAINDWSPLNRLFSAPEVIKVFHACSEDLELFYSLGIDQPTMMVDTQIAVALLGGELNEGLFSLVNRLLDIKLNKHETRSDWVQRPLTDEQLKYAKEDVVILLPLWAKLQALLEQNDKLDILLAECADMVNNATSPMADSQIYLKLRGGWKLKPPAQALLSVLAAWREQTAREMNIARRFICSDDDLLAMAQYKPRTLADITRQTSIQGASLRHHGKPMLGLIKAHKVSSEQLSEMALIRPPLPKDKKAIYKAVKAEAHKWADKLDVQPTLLASRSMLESLVSWYIRGQKGDLPQLLKGWRGERIGNRLLAILKQEDAN